MKIKHLFSFILIFSITCLAQQNEKELKLNNYLNTLKKYQTNKAYTEFGRKNDKDFKLIVKATYEAIEIAPDELHDIFALDHVRWEEEVKSDRNKMYANIKYGVVQRVILDEIKNRYSEVFYLLTRIPIFIKAKVISIKEGSDDAGFAKIVIKLKPEKIIKGKESFIFEQEFDVYYRNYELVPSSKEFKVGNSYLILLWDRNEPANPEFAVATWVDEQGSRFLIEDDVLYDEHNIFNMGTKVGWDEFVKNINDKIYRIINLLEY